MRVLTIVADQNIFRLQVSVDNVFFVEMRECKGNLGGKEFGCRFREFPYFDQMTEEFAARHKFHEEVDAKFILEHEFHVNEERVVNCSQYILFQLNILHLLIFKDNILSDAFHGI